MTTRMIITAQARLADCSPASTSLLLYNLMAKSSVTEVSHVNPLSEETLGIIYYS